MTLHLWQNQIGIEGARYLAEALTMNQVSDNGLSMPSIMVELCSSFQTLTTLNIGGNSIGDAGAIAIGDALKTNQVHHFLLVHDF